MTIRSLRMIRLFRLIFTPIIRKRFELSEKVYKLLTDNEYYHEMTMDVPNPDTSIKHKTMRFVKVVERND